MPGTVPHSECWFVTLMFLLRDGSAAAHRVWRQRPLPGGEGARDGGGASCTQRQHLCDLCGSGRPQLTGKRRRRRVPCLDQNLLLNSSSVLQDSILDIKVPIFKGPGELPEIRSYMDEFPFPFYVILRDVNALPETLSDALRQWFELVTAADPWPPFTLWWRRTAAEDFPDLLSCRSELHGAPCVHLWWKWPPYLKLKLISSTLEQPWCLSRKHLSEL